MKTIRERNILRFSFLLILSGLGAIWLSIVWRHMIFKDGLGLSNGVALDNVLFLYYIFNSSLLIILGILIRIKQFRIFSFLSILLCISVSLSLVISRGNVNLFIYTLFNGITFYFAGGPILIPMFLISVYKSVFLAFLFTRNKLIFLD